MANRVAQAATCDQDHEYTDEEAMFNLGLMDNFLGFNVGGCTANAGHPNDLALALSFFFATNASVYHDAGIPAQECWLFPSRIERLSISLWALSRRAEYARKINGQAMVSGHSTSGPPICPRAPAPSQGDCESRR